MVKIVLFLAILFSPILSFAETAVSKEAKPSLKQKREGFVSAMGGFPFSTTRLQNLISDNTQIAYKFTAGYFINEYLGISTGIAMTSSYDAKHRRDIPLPAVLFNPQAPLDAIVNTPAVINVKQSYIIPTVALLAGGIFDNGARLYGKLGAYWAFSGRESNGTINGNPFPMLHTVDNDDYVGPIIGIGVIYPVAKYLAIQLEAEKFIRMGKYPDKYDIDFITFGVSFRF